MKGEHLTYEERKIICSCLSKGHNLKTIADLISKDPTTISKEIKSKRFISKKGIDSKECPKLNRYPYVCNHCQFRYTTCKYTHFRYDAKYADDIYKQVLSKSRIGINCTEEEFKNIDAQIHEGVTNKHSIYHIVKENKNFPSVSTIYRWINEGKLSIKRYDLPNAVTYKKRKANMSQYAYPTKIDTTGRTFLDYQRFRLNHPNAFTVQMDFLGKIITDSKDILTLTIPDLHFVLLVLYEKRQTAFDVGNMFNALQDHLGIDDFKKLFPCILTDRDTVFQNFARIELDAATGEYRTRVYYCDAYHSWQKGNVENMNKQQRKFFPKGKSLDKVCQEDVKAATKFLNEQRIQSLNGESPENAFKYVYGDKLFEKLMNFTWTNK